MSKLAKSLGLTLSGNSTKLRQSNDRMKVVWKPYEKCGGFSFQSQPENVERARMIYQGNAITVTRRDTPSGNDIAMLTFDLKDESVNKLSSAVVAELSEAVKAIQATKKRNP